MKTLFANVAEIDHARAQSGKLYSEFLHVPTMSAGLYVLPPGSTDPQRPHHEDEIYYVVRREVSAGSVLFVAAEVEHRFYDVTEELAVLVVFAPAES